MTLNEFVKAKLHELMAEAARLAADGCDDPDECAAIPAAFFHVENAMWGAWLEETGQGDPTR